MFPSQLIETEAAVLPWTRGRRTWSRRGQRGAEAASSPRTRRRGRVFATDEEVEAASRHKQGGGGPCLILDGAWQDEANWVGHEVQGVVGRAT